MIATRPRTLTLFDREKYLLVKVKEAGRKLDLELEARRMYDVIDVFPIQISGENTDEHG